MSKSKLPKLTAGPASTTPASPLVPWPVIATEPATDFRIFTVRKSRKRSPRTGQDLDFVVLHCPDWVNVVAVTPNDQLVMIEQFRHGSETVELEIPGGMIDRADASPIAAGVRELREETGYEGSQVCHLNRVLPNPAIMTNTCHTVLVRDCELRHPLELDHGEDLRTVLVPVGEIPELVANRRIQHSLVVVALYYFELWRRGTLQID